MYHTSNRSRTKTNSSAKTSGKQIIEHTQPMNYLTHFPKVTIRTKQKRQNDMMTWKIHKTSKTTSPLNHTQVHAQTTDSRPLLRLNFKPKTTRGGSPVNLLTQKKPQTLLSPDIPLTSRLRIVVDLTRINRLLKNDCNQHNHPVTTMADAAHHMAGKRYFCKLGCSQACHCLQMAAEQSVQSTSFPRIGFTSNCTMRYPCSKLKSIWHRRRPSKTTTKKRTYATM